MIFNIVCSYSFLSRYFVGRSIFEITLKNILIGIFFRGVNTPFWFIFNLIVFSAAAPLIHLVIRNKYVGMATIVVVTILTNFGFGLPTKIFFSSTSIVFFLIGALIGKHYFEFTTKKSAKWMQWVSIVFLITHVVLKNIFVSATIPGKPIWQVVVLTLSSFAVWNITDMFIHKIKPRKLYSRSFAVFALHANVAAIITKLIVLCFPKDEWMAIPNFFATAILTLFVIQMICIFLEKFLPKVYNVLMGNRVKKQA